MIKKILCCILVAVMALSVFSGCNSENTADSGKLSVVTTIFPIYDFARQIAGDNAQITMLLSPGTESHVYEPSPKDIVKIQNCDLFIYIGGESEKWVDDILESLDNDKMNILSLIDKVPLINEEITEGMQTEHEHNYDDGHSTEYDEHIWTSPKNAMIMCKEIRNALINVDTDNKDLYTSNEKAYNAELSLLDSQFMSTVSDGKRKTLVFGDRFPFAYFAKEYGLKYYAAFPGCSGETEPAASTVAFLIDKVKEENIPAIFYIEFSSEKMADTICGETKAKKLLFHSCHNVTKDEFESGITYVELMNKNLTALKEALK